MMNSNRNKSMKKAKSKKILLNSFNEFSEAERKNLRWHGRRRTPVACGSDARKWVGSEGFG